jgi:hypothetical protein
MTGKPWSEVPSSMQFEHVCVVQYPQVMRDKQRKTLVQRHQLAPVLANSVQAHAVTLVTIFAVPAMRFP